MFFNFYKKQKYKKCFYIYGSIDIVPNTVGL